MNVCRDCHGARLVVIPELRVIRGTTFDFETKRCDRCQGTGIDPIPDVE